MKESSQIFPFFFLDKFNLLESNGIDLPSQLKLSESYDFKAKLTNMPSLHDFGMDENLIHKVNSYYYDIITFPKTMKTKDCFSLYHVNLTLFDMGFFLNRQLWGGGGGAWGPTHHNFVVIAPMIMKFGIGVKLDVFYTMVTKIVTSLLLRHYDVITCILANA